MLAISMGWLDRSLSGMRSACLAVSCSEGLMHEVGSQGFLVDETAMTVVSRSKVARVYKVM